MYESDAFRHTYGAHAYHMAAHAPPQMPPDMQFGRVPPEPFGRPINMLHSERMSQMKVRHADPSQVRDKVEEFRRMFGQQAAGLLSTGTLPVPPGHPLYDRHLAISSLEAERDKLLKENADLKRRLEGSEDGASSSNNAAGL